MRIDKLYHKFKTANKEEKSYEGRILIFETIEEAKRNSVKRIYKKETLIRNLEKYGVKNGWFKRRSLNLKDYI